MKFSMCTAVYGMNDLHDTIDRAAMHGFDAVELTAALHMPVSSPQQYRREVRGWIREAGLACSALHYIFDGSVKLATAAGKGQNFGNRRRIRLRQVDHRPRYPAAVGRDQWHGHLRRERCYKGNARGNAGAAEGYADDLSGSLLISESPQNSQSADRGAHHPE